MRRRANPTAQYFDGDRGQMIHFDYVEHHVGPAGKETYLLPDGTWLSGVRKERWGNLNQRRKTKGPPRWLGKTGANPRAPKGTPTSTNLFVLYEIFGDKKRVPNRIPATSAPHMRRLVAAGLVTIEGSELALTPAGIEAVREQDRKYRQRMGHPLSERERRRGRNPRKPKVSIGGRKQFSSVPAARKALKKAGFRFRPGRNVWTDGERELQIFEYKGVVEIDEITKNPRRLNRPEPLTRASYPSVFDDTDRDEIPDVDDPHPFQKGDVKSIEEIRLSDEVGQLLTDRQSFVPAMKETMGRLESIGIAGSKVEGRVKTPFSLVNKLRRKYLSALTDVAGTRIIVPDQPSVELAESAIEDGFEILEKEDFYESPLAGYRAIHYIVRVNGVPVELQLKTRRMAEIADASHTAYKRGLLDAAAMDRLTTLAAKADAGNKKAAQEIDKILRDRNRVKKELTRKQNPQEVRQGRIATRLANP